MNLGEITKTLTSIYTSPLSNNTKRHIVFWYDAKGEFIEDIETLELENVRLLKLTENNYFYIRYELEKIDTTSNILIYANMEKPKPSEDWLIDILKYSTEFSTDKITVLMRELQVEDISLREVFKSYSNFFNNKERYNIFKKYNIKHYSEDIIHVAILSALCKLPNIDFEKVLKTLIQDTLTEDNKHMELIRKFGNVDVFWDLVSRIYGYNLEAKTLEDLIIFLMLNDMDDKVDFELPKNLQNYLSEKKSDCIVFINHFMNDRESSLIYDKISDDISDKINLIKLMEKVDIDNIIKCDTFRYFDEFIIKKIIDRIQSGAGEFDKYLSEINHRKSLYWYKDYKYSYEALYYAIELFKLKESMGDIQERSPLSMFEKYYKDDKTPYYLIDKCYRKFYMYYDKVDNSDLLDDIRIEVEKIYTNWYLNDLSIKWSSSLKENLEGEWNIPGILSQKMFYSNYVEPHLYKNERVFVIISDAFRYECAKELCDIINLERRGTATVEAMQGVLPSYTKLGMASLLPNSNIVIDDNNVYIDGINTSSTENRDKILKSKCHDSIAITYNSLKDLSSSEFRNTFTGKKVIYIYHNVIDARGDNSLSEREVFEAVEDTFNELKQLIGKLINRSNASNIYITSDHGFLYRRGGLSESDKLKYDGEANSKRYVFTDEIKEQTGTMTFSMDYILEKDNKKYVTVPKGVIRFSKQGSGSNYVHGGAMLQEIVIPVIKYKNSRGEGKNTNNKVEVELSTISRKITTPRVNISFIQKDKVEDKKLPIQLKARFEDEDGNIISNENSIIADSDSSNIDDRIYKERFVLKSIKYSKNKKYYLVLVEDSQIENEYARYEFNIDIAIQNDFGF